MPVTVITAVTIPGVRPQGTGDDTSNTDTVLAPISNGTPKDGITEYGVQSIVPLSSLFAIETASLTHNSDKRLPPHGVLRSKTALLVDLQGICPVTTRHHLTFSPVSILRPKFSIQDDSACSAPARREHGGSWLLAISLCTEYSVNAQMRISLVQNAVCSAESSMYQLCSLYRSP